MLRLHVKYMDDGLLNRKNGTEGGEEKQESKTKKNSPTRPPLPIPDPRAHATDLETYIPEQRAKQ